MKRQERGPFLTDPATAVRVARDSHASRIVGLGCVTIAPVPPRWLTEDMWAAIWRHYGNSRHHWRERAEAIAWANPYDRFYVENALCAYVAGTPGGRGREIHNEGIAGLCDSLGSVNRRLEKLWGEARRIKAGLAEPVAAFGPELLALPIEGRGQDADAYELVAKLEEARRALFDAERAAEGLLEKRRARRADRRPLPDVYATGAEANRFRLGARLAALWRAAGANLGGGADDDGFPAFLEAALIVADGTMPPLETLLAQLRAVDFGS